MKKSAWLYISIVLFVALLIMSISVLNYSYVFIKYENSNLQDDLDLLPENNYYADEPCVPDAKTAARIGSAVLDNMCNASGFGLFRFTYVEYDEANRVWRVTKSYVRTSGIVIIDQDTGEIIRALFQK